jgi:hypothetical protein
MTARPAQYRAQLALPCDRLPIPSIKRRVQKLSDSIPPSQLAPLFETCTIVVLNNLGKSADADLSSTSERDGIHIIFLFLIGVV